MGRKLHTKYSTTLIFFSFFTISSGQNNSLDVETDPVKKSMIYIIFSVGVLILAGAIFVLYFWWHLGDNRGYAPDQPFSFSHKIHAGDNGVPCMYCHFGAYQSKHATVPPLNVCMNCHKVVKTDSPKIQQLKEKYENGETIEWIKIHDMPDFVVFNHKRHILKGVECKECHGPVETMDTVRQIQKLEMGFCISCHRQEKYKAPTDCYTCHN